MKEKSFKIHRISELTAENKNVKRYLWQHCCAAYWLDCSSSLIFGTLSGYSRYFGEEIL